MYPIPSIILAGGETTPELKSLIGVKNRANYVFNHKTLLSHVVDSLRNSRAVSDIVVLGDVPDSEYYSRLADTGGFVSNVLSGLSRFPNAKYLLIATADLPFLTGEIVAEFIRQSLEKVNDSGAELVYPVVAANLCYNRFPGIQRTAVRLREGEFTGGNLVLVRPAFLMSRSSQLEEVYAARKKPAQLAAILGFQTSFRLMMSKLPFPRMLSISMLEDRASILMGAPVRAVISSDPELATDVDRPSDFKALTRSLDDPLGK